MTAQKISILKLKDRVTRTMIKIRLNNFARHALNN
jgi:hypothetical protein